MMVQTLTTVGYGDWVSIDSYERIIDMFIQVLGATSFGYILAKVTNFLGSVNAYENQKREKLAEVSDYLTENLCPKPLYSAVIKQCRYSLQCKSEYDEKTLLLALPDRLSNEISFDIYSSTMLRIPMFGYIDNKQVALHIFLQVLYSSLCYFYIVFNKSNDFTNLFDI